MKRFIPTALLSLLILSACSHLSKEAKEIAGTYYNPEVSQTEPVMQLYKNAKCVVTAIRPEVLTYSLDGKWNVINDSLIIDLNPTTLRFEGDSALIGEIPARIKRKVADHNDFSLTLENDGISYLYQRRNE